MLVQKCSRYMFSPEYYHGEVESSPEKYSFINEVKKMSQSFKNLFHHYWNEIFIPCKIFFIDHSGSFLIGLPTLANQSCCRNTAFGHAVTCRGSEIVILFELDWEGNRGEGDKIRSFLKGWNFSLTELMESGVVATISLEQTFRNNRS